MPSTDLAMRAVSRNMADVDEQSAGRPVFALPNFRHGRQARGAPKGVKRNTNNYVSAARNDLVRPSGGEYIGAQNG
jgi:hypothetical protein